MIAKAVFKEVRLRRAGAKVSGVVVGTSAGSSASPPAAPVNKMIEDPEPVAGRSKEPLEPAPEAKASEKKDLSRVENNVLLQTQESAQAGNKRDLTHPTNNPLLQI